MLRRRLLPVSLAAAWLIACMASACGTGGSDQNFASCGNGRVDTGESCDDGNLDEHDACTSACQSAGCGDGVARTGIEVCDGRDFNGAGCESISMDGFARCDVTCQHIDYSSCIARMPTPTPLPPSPTPTATSAASCGDGLLSNEEACTDCAGDSTCTVCAADCVAQACTVGTDEVVVTVMLGVPSSMTERQLRLSLAYRTNAVSLPSTSLQMRFRSVATQNLVLRPTDVDYAVNVAIAASSPLQSGPAFTVRFDRCADAAAATDADFACRVTNCGTASGCTCTATVQ